MGLREEIIPYTDRYELVAPHKISVGATGRGSDNGLMFTSEYIIMLCYLGAANFWDKLHYLMTVGLCAKTPGNFYRAPQDPDAEAPDDYYGLTAAAKVTGSRVLGLQILWHGITHLGFFNATQSFRWDACLWRQPQLVAATASAAGLGWLPIFWPFYLYTGFVVGFSCYKVPTQNADARRLSWLLIQATWSSIFTKIGAWFWYRRLYKDYGSDGMKQVAKIYYAEGHPFQKYWVDRRPK